MGRKRSKLEISREKGENQVEEQRINILDAAERQFLEKGLENINMTDIAQGAGINRASLYRYFPDLHTIAFEIAVRTMKRISAAVVSGGEESNLENFRKTMLTAIDKFFELQTAFQFMGMFDHLYSAAYPNEELAVWYKQQLFPLQLGIDSEDLQKGQSDVAVDQIVMIGNCVMSFLQKLAARGALMAVEQEVSISSQLKLFKNLINTYFNEIEPKA